MNNLNPKHVEAVIGLINQGPFFRLLSIQIKELGLGHSLVEMEIGNQHLNPFGDCMAELMPQRSIRQPTGRFIVSCRRRPD